MKFFRSLRVEKSLRTTAIILAVVVGYVVLRAIPPVARVLGFVEHGFVVVGTGIGTLVTRVTAPENSLQSQLALCEERLRDSTLRQSELADAEQRVAELEALLAYVRGAGATAIVAGVTSRSLPQAATVQLDRGSADGIAVGQAVVVDDGHLYGVITSVTEATSDVRLVHSRESRVPAMIIGRSRTIGLINGQEGSLLHMEFIPQDATIRQGDIVVTSGLEGALLPNLVIGMVTNVIQEETAPFLEAIIEPLYESRDWTTVLVLTPAL